ncbi:MAG: hypothetical protein ACW964_17595 [Candidatus Hodarchaeales archaeon]
MDQKFIFIILLFTILTFNLENVTGAVTASWGDVVDVKYSLWEDAAHTIEVQGNIGVTLTYIYPEANPNYLQAFKEAVIGMAENGEKEFMIAKEDAYGDRDLYYHVELIKIWYDASLGSAPEESTTSTTRTNTPAPFQDFNAIFAIGAGLTVVVGGFLIWNFRASRNMQSIVSKESLSSTMREQTIKKERTALKEIKELTESHMEKPDLSQDQSEVKFRRRRK